MSDHAALFFYRCGGIHHTLWTGTLAATPVKLLWRRPQRGRVSLPWGTRLSPSSAQNASAPVGRAVSTLSHAGATEDYIDV